MTSTFAQWNQQATEWLKTKAGRRARIGLLGVTVVAYPIGAIICNGPLVKLTFPRRHNVEELPQSLAKIADEEYRRFLDKENRVPKDAVVNFYAQKDLDSDDTVATGSLGVRTGLCLGAPVYTQFESVSQVLEYFRSKCVDAAEFLGERIPMNLCEANPQAVELADCYVLSQNALRFLFLRDLYAHDGYASLAQRSISWTTWTTFTSIFSYWLHKHTKIAGGTAASFVAIYTVFLGAAWYANQEWCMLYRYLTDVHADAEAARASFEHAEGGKEYYWKMMKRNRIYRDLKPSLYTKVAATGDIRGIATPLIVRYDHLKDVNAEDDELKDVVNLDD